MISKENIEHIPLVSYLPAFIFDAADLVWDDDLRLPPGTVLMFDNDTHPDTLDTYVFESIEAKALKAATGLLSIVRAGEVISQRQDAAIDLVHPVRDLAAANKPSVEFNLVEGDRKTRITYPYSRARVIYSEKLAQAVMLDKIVDEAKDPLLAEGVTEVIGNLIDFYDKSATAYFDTDLPTAQRLSSIADQLRHDFGIPDTRPE